MTRKFYGEGNNEIKDRLRSSAVMGIFSTNIWARKGRAKVWARLLRRKERKVEKSPILAKRTRWHQFPCRFNLIALSVNEPKIRM